MMDNIDKELMELRHEINMMREFHQKEHGEIIHAVDDLAKEHQREHAEIRNDTMAIRQVVTRIMTGGVVLMVLLQGWSYVERLVGV